MNGCGLFAIFCLAMTAISVAIAANARARRAFDELGALRARMDAMARALANLRKERDEPEAAETAGGFAEAPAAATEPVIAPPAPSVAPPSMPAAFAPPPAPVSATLPQTPIDEMVSVVPEQLLRRGLDPFAAKASSDAATIAPALPTGTAPAPGGHTAGFESAPPGPEPPATSPSPTPPRPPSKPFDWESLIGVKLFSWIAGIALVLAAVFALKYSVEHGWVSPAVRATFGILIGSALIVVCELRFARGYKFTTNALHGAGIAILYATLFSTYALWHLLSPAVVFPLMLLVTAVAVFLSVRHDSVFIALLGLLGGFATPALLSTGENRPVGLFSYLLLLNAGLAFVAYRKRWPALTLCSVALTAIYQWSWIATYLTPAQLPLAAGIFIVFAMTAATALWAGRGDDDSAQRTFERTALAGAVLPLMFAVFAAAVPAYGARYNTLFGFLLLVDAGLAAIAIARGHRWLHMLGGATTLLVFAVWTATSYHESSWPAILAWIAVFVAGYLVTERFARTDAVFTSPLLLFMFPTLLAIEDATRAPALLFAVLFLLLGAVAAYSLLARRGMPYFIACFFAIVAEGVWSARFLEPQNLWSALLLYAVFAILFLAVPALARRRGKALTPVAGTGIILLLSVAILFFLAGGSSAETALGCIAILLLLINGGGIVEARASSKPAISAALTTLSWLVLAWWSLQVTLAHHLVPGLATFTGFALLTVAGNWWASRRAGEEASFANSTYLALAAHFFLFFGAGTRALALPPWPLFVALVVLDVAIGLAALHLKRERLFAASMAASQIVLLIWSTNAVDVPWPQVALVATLIVAAMAVVWYRIDSAFSGAAFLALFLGQIVAMSVSRFAAAPTLGVLIATQLTLAVAILVVAALTETHETVVLAVFTTAAATALAKTHTPLQAFVFAAALYSPFIAYPLSLGKRARQSLLPHLAAVFGSVFFFFFARQAIIDGGYRGVVGLLPLSQAALMALLLYGLLKIEPPGARALNRLALVAGTALAFVTVAIPLQLDKQWITVAWALEGAALVWLFRRIPHRGLLLWSGALLAAVVVRLTLNEAIFDYHARTAMPIVNWYLYTYLVCAASLFAAAWLWLRDERLVAPRAVSALNAAGTMLLFFLLNIEIADFYSKGAHLTFNFFSSSLAQDLTYTIAWAVFAIGMLIAGIIAHARSARVAALVLLLVTILKCFLHDLGRLGGLYRVGSLLGLAISLVLVGILLQRFVMVRPAEEPISADR